MLVLYKFVENLCFGLILMLLFEGFWYFVGIKLDFEFIIGIILVFVIILVLDGMLVFIMDGIMYFKFFIEGNVLVGDCILGFFGWFILVFSFDIILVVDDKVFIMFVFVVLLVIMLVIFGLLFIMFISMVIIFGMLILDVFCVILFEFGEVIILFLFGIMVFVEIIIGLVLFFLVLRMVGFFIKWFWFWVDWFGLLIGGLEFIMVFLFNVLIIVVGFFWLKKG